MKRILSATLLLLLLFAFPVYAAPPSISISNSISVDGGLVWKGAYAAGIDYTVGDAVTYNGSSYAMFVDAAAGTAPTDTTKWNVIANKGETGDKGDDGDPGATGADGKTVLYGTAEPTTEGNDGDFYIRTTTNYIYGPKATTWPAGASIKGDKGDKGDDGEDGLDGDGSGDVLAGTMGTTGQYCTKNASTKTIDCNTTPSYAASNAATTVNGQSCALSGSCTVTASLPSNPSACSAGQYVSDIAADGTLTCGTPAGGGTVDISGTPANHYWTSWTDADTIKGTTITASKPVCSDANGDPVVCAGTEGVWQVAGSYLTSALPAALTNAAATTWTAVDNNASAISIGSTGKADIIKVITTDAGEGVSMSGTLTVIGALSAPSITTTAAASTGGYVRLSEGSDNGTDYSSITGAANAGSYPSFTFAGSQGGEDLTVTASSNTWTASSSTGVTDLNFSALNLVTTGTIQGGIKISSDADGMSNSEMTAVGLYGTLFIATGNGTWTLDTAVQGMSGCLKDKGTAHDLILDVQAGDDISLGGTEQANGVGITNASGTSTGDMICFVAISNGHWEALSPVGTWASQ